MQKTKTTQQMYNGFGALSEDDVPHVETCRNEVKKQQKQCKMHLLGFNITIRKES
jgi:hypothetical protein